MIEGISSVYTLYIINKYVPMSKVLNKGGDLTVLNQLLLRMYKKLINAECVIAQPVDSPPPANHWAEDPQECVVFFF